MTNSADYRFSPEVVLVHNAQSLLGEGPYWDHQNHELYWVDIESKAIHRHDPVSDTNKVVYLDQMPGAVALDYEGGIVCGVESGFAHLDSTNTQIKALTPIEAHRTSNRMNEGKCDPYGRFYTGTMDKNLKPFQGSLYRIDPDGSVHQLVTEVSISNGMDWSLDEQYFYYIDSPKKCVDVFNYHRHDGSLSHRSRFLDLNKYPGVPDGMTLDAQGCLWIAFWGEGVVRCFSSEGLLIQEIRVPASQVSSVCFGGLDLQTLYITTARTGLTPHQLQSEPWAGGLFSVHTPIKGRPCHRYGRRKQEPAPNAEYRL